MIPSPGLARVQRRHMRDANVWRLTETADGAGGVATSWTLLDDPVPVVFGIPSPAERATAMQEGVEYGYIVKAPVGSGLLRGDRLVRGGVTVELTSSAVSSVGEVEHLRGKAEPWDEPLPIASELVPDPDEVDLIILDGEVGA